MITTAERPLMAFEVEAGNVGENEVISWSDLQPEDLDNPEALREWKLRLGGKGLSLAIMRTLGMPVPEGITLSTQIGLALDNNEIDELPSVIVDKVRQQVEAMTNSFDARFGDPDNPLLVSTRSGAYFSMPGMMDTVMNVGVTDENIEALTNRISEKAAYRCYQIFCLEWISSCFQLDKDILIKKINQSLGKVKTQDKTAARYQDEVAFLKSWVKDNFQTEIPQDPWEQLFTSIQAIYDSYHSPESVVYRHRMGLPEKNFATAVNIVAVAFGNVGEPAGAGTLFTHSPNGESHYHIQFAKGGIGDSVVAGRGEEFAEEVPEEVKEDLITYAKELEEFRGGPVDIEFVVQDGELFLLQFRGLKLPAPAKLNMLVRKFRKQRQNLSEQEEKELLTELITPELLADFKVHFPSEAIAEAKDNEESQETPRFLFAGHGIGGSAFVGKLVTKLNQAKSHLDAGEKVVYVAESITNPGDVLGLGNHVADKLAVITKVGSPHSHAANIFNGHGVVGAIGCGQDTFKISDQGISFNGTTITTGEILSVDGESGEVFLDELPIVEYKLEDDEGAIVEKRRQLGVSMWEAAVKALDLEEKFHQLEDKLEKFLAEQESGQGWQSPKAQSQEIINLLFPEECQTKYVTVNMLADDARQEVEDLVRAGWEEGHDITVRSAFMLSKDGDQLGVNPWFLLKPGEDEKLATFLYGDEEEFSDHKYGPLARWPSLVGGKAVLSEVLVGFNPPGKLDQDKADLHAVGALRMPLSTRPKIEGTLHPETAHLRSFELDVGDEQGYNPEDEIHFTAYVDPQFADSISRVNISFGRNHLNESAVDELVNRLIELDYQQAKEVLSTSQLALYQELAKKTGGAAKADFEFILTDSAAAKKALLRMIKDMEVPSVILEDLVKADYWLQASELIGEILQRQLANLVPGLAAIENWLSQLQEDDDTGEVSVEFQAKIPPGTTMNHGDNWWHLYGIKGVEEIAMAVAARDAA